VGSIREEAFVEQSVRSSHIHRPEVPPYCCTISCTRKIQFIKMTSPHNSRWSSEHVTRHLSAALHRLLHLSNGTSSGPTYDYNYDDDDDNASSEQQQQTGKPPTDSYYDSHPDPRRSQWSGDWQDDFSNSILKHFLPLVILAAAGFAAGLTLFWLLLYLHRRRSAARNNRADPFARAQTHPAPLSEAVKEKRKQFIERRIITRTWGSEEDEDVDVSAQDAAVADTEKVTTRIDDAVDASLDNDNNNYSNVDIGPGADVARLPPLNENSSSEKVDSVGYKAVLDVDYGDTEAAASAAGLSQADQPTKATNPGGSLSDDVVAAKATDSIDPATDADARHQIGQNFGGEIREGYDVEEAAIDAAGDTKYGRDDDDEDSDRGPECSICLASFVTGQRVCQSKYCPHVFHEECMMDWLLTPRDDCPVCRETYLFRRKKRAALEPEQPQQQLQPEPTDQEQLQQRQQEEAEETSTENGSNGTVPQLLGENHEESEADLVEDGDEERGRFDDEEAQQQQLQSPHAPPDQEEDEEDRRLHQEQQQQAEQQEEEQQEERPPV